jgi:hypothetical protein
VGIFIAQLIDKVRCVTVVVPGHAMPSAVSLPSLQHGRVYPRDPRQPYFSKAVRAMQDDGEERPA